MTERRNRQVPQVPATDAADRKIRQLGTELDGIDQATRPVVQIDTFTVRIESKAQMAARGRRVLVGKEDQILAWIHRHAGGKDELGRPLRIVAQAHAGQAHRRRTVVVQLDHIRERALVFENRLVDRQDLVDDQVPIGSIHGPGPRGRGAVGILPGTGGVLAHDVNRVGLPILEIR